MRVQVPLVVTRLAAIAQLGVRRFRKADVPTRIRLAAPVRPWRNRYRACLPSRSRRIVTGRTLLLPFGPVSLPDSERQNRRVQSNCRGRLVRGPERRKFASVVQRLGRQPCKLLTGVRIPADAPLGPWLNWESATMALWRARVRNPPGPPSVRLPRPLPSDTAGRQECGPGPSPCTVPARECAPFAY